MVVLFVFGQVSAMLKLVSQGNLQVLVLIGLWEVRTWNLLMQQQGKEAVAVHPDSANTYFMFGGLGYMERYSICSKFIFST